MKTSNHFSSLFLLQLPTRKIKKKKKSAFLNFTPETSKPKVLNK